MRFSAPSLSLAFATGHTLGDMLLWDGVLKWCQRILVAVRCSRSLTVIASCFGYLAAMPSQERIPGPGTENTQGTGSGSFELDMFDQGRTCRSGRKPRGAGTNLQEVRYDVYEIPTTRCKWIPAMALARPQQQLGTLLKNPACCQKSGSHMGPTKTPIITV
jgi:hypothetical protein